MRDLGNTLIVVEHDEDTMREADWTYWCGTCAGAFGGQIMASGTPEEVLRTEFNHRAISVRCKSILFLQNVVGNGRFIEVKGASENNLKNVSVKFPLGKLIAVTGVSGSGKSTLVNGILKKKIAQELNRNSEKPGKHKSVTGIEYIERLIDIDQKSNWAYTSF